MDTRDATLVSRAFLVRAVHAAGADVAAWRGVIGQLRLLLDARVVTLGHHDFGTGLDSALIESPAEAGFEQGLAPFAARNPWFLSTASYIDGRVFTGDELISFDELRKTDFYRAFLQPRGLLHRLCGVVVRQSAGVHLLSAYRTEGQGVFGAREKADLAWLLDHIKMALENYWLRQEATDLARALLALTDHETNPVVVANCDGESIYSNRAAGQLSEKADGLRLEDRRLVAASAADHRLLCDTIKRVAQTDPEKSTASSAVLTLRRLPPARPVVVVVRPLGQVFMRQALQRCGLVVVTVRAGHPWHDPANCIFTRDYGLTAAQAKVGALIVSGEPVRAIARSLNVSENTVRSHLKQVFQKTDTHGQIDLIHLHARVCTTQVTHSGQRNG